MCTHLKKTVALLETVLVLAGVFVPVVVEGRPVPRLDPLHPGPNVHAGLTVQSPQAFYKDYGELFFEKITMREMIVCKIGHRYSVFNI
jgi:hypothetical protein